jgi:hypothetical protein
MYVCQHCGEVTYGARAKLQAQQPNMVLAVGAIIAAAIGIVSIVYAVRWML